MSKACRGPGGREAGEGRLSVTVDSVGEECLIEVGASIGKGIADAAGDAAANLARALPTDGRSIVSAWLRGAA